jgi:sucrose-6-phosphate hydrolase SacC (GH32 family)
MSLPRILTLSADGRVAVAPAPTVTKLRKHEQKLRLTPAKGADSKELVSDQRLKDACGELLCVVKPQAAPFTLDLLNPAAPTVAPKEAPKPATEETEKEDTAPAAPLPTITTEASFLSIRYSQANPKELVVDQQRLPINLAAGEPLELHFYIDGSVIELFVNNQTTFTKRFYYPGPTAPEIAVSITGKASDITRLSLWQLSPISKDRLTT